MDTGSRIKRFRKAKNMTLQQLSDLTGLSASHLSNIERNVTSPTISCLFQICEALGEDLTTFLETLTMKNPVVRANEREVLLSFDTTRTRIESMNRVKSKLNAFCLTLAPGGISGNEPQRHPDQDEVVTVIEGAIEITLEDMNYHLEVGDTIYVKAGTYHSYKNITNTVCVLHFVMG